MTFRRSLLLVLAAEALIVIAAVLLYGVNVTGLQAATRFPEDFLLYYLV